MKLILLILMITTYSFSNEKMIGINGGISTLKESTNEFSKNGNTFEIQGIYSIDTKNINYDIGFGYLRNEIKGSNQFKTITIKTNSGVLNLDSKFKFDNLLIGPAIKITMGTDTSFDSKEGKNSINSFLGLKGQYLISISNDMSYRIESGLYSTLTNPQNLMIMVGFVLGWNDSKITAKIEEPFRVEEKPETSLKIILTSARILFENNDYSIDEELSKKLKELASFLKQNNSGWKRIKISGHTDNVGSFESNKKLSQNRSDSIKKILVLEGIDESKIESVSFSYLRPIASNLTKEGRSKNRRTEIEFFGIINREIFNKNVIEILK